MKWQSWLGIGRRQVLIGLVALGAIALTVATALGSLAASDSNPVVLSGHVLPVLTSATRVGALQPDQQLTLSVALRPPSPGSLRDAAADPAGPAGAVGLSAADFGRRFGRPQADVDDVAAYFQSFGLAPSGQAPDNLSFRVTGTARQIQQALGVSLDMYRDSAGRSYFATSVEPRLPSRLAGFVQAIFGLDNYPAFRSKMALQTTAGQYTPSDMRTAYDLNPLYTSGFDGTGQTIAIIGFNTFLASDLTSFDQQYGLPQNTVTVVPVDGGTTDFTSPETTMDLEWSHAIASGAAQRFYAFPSVNGGGTNQDLLVAVTAATNDNVASVISISLGACELTTGTTYIQAFENEFAAAAAKGVGVFVASGDSGAYECSPYPIGPPGVSYPAASAFVTAVGGTSLFTSSSGTYSSESTWGSATECGGPCGSGGGISALIAEPSWQSSAPIPTTAGFRALPDVSWNADPATGNELYYSGTNGACVGLCGGYGGTSIASPQWAGVAAIANQKAGRRLGQLAPLLYSSSVRNATAPYHDVTQGNNLFYNATTGWDFATGWGSPDGNNVVSALVAGAASTPTPTAQPISTATPTGVVCGAVSASIEVAEGFGVAASGQTTTSVIYLPAVSNPLPASPTPVPSPTPTPCATATPAATNLATPTAIRTSTPVPPTPTPVKVATATPTPGTCGTVYSYTWSVSAYSSTYGSIYLNQGHTLSYWGTVSGSGQPILTYILDSNGSQVYGAYNWSNYGSFAFKTSYNNTFYLYLENDFPYNDTAVFSSQVC